MIAQILLSLLLGAVLAYAWHEHRRFPAVASLSTVAATCGLYFVWFPGQATLMAEAVGIGRGVDLIIYIWVCISLLVLANLHLKLRAQSEVVTNLARAMALNEAKANDERGRAT
jgi:hypothetical protein